MYPCDLSITAVQQCLEFLLQDLLSGLLCFYHSSYLCNAVNCENSYREACVVYFRIYPLITLKDYSYREACVVYFRIDPLITLKDSSYREACVVYFRIGPLITLRDCHLSHC